MEFRHNDIEINEEKPFSNCKLEREKYAEVLTNIIDNYPEGFVLAINNKWGTGKSTFVKMWEQSLKNLQFKTIYFNAWENDFEDNPLTAFLGELQILNKKEEDKFNKVVKNAAVISKNVAPAILKAFLNRYVDSEVLVDAITDTSKSAFEIFEEDVKEYSKRKKSISEFRKSLSEFVANESNGKPLIFIIDELDRCRPNYAVLLLEQIKHFFSVPNIVFVLSIDKEQLGNAICGVYGSEKIDTNEYLRRFIDIEYSIPEPDPNKFFDYLFEYFEFDVFFKSEERNQYRGVEHDRETFRETCKVLISNLTLRQQEKILSHTRIVLRTLNYNSLLFASIFVFLVYIKTIHPKYYQKLSSKNTHIRDIQREFYEISKPFISEDKHSQRLFTHIEAYLLKLYSTYQKGYMRNNELIEWNSTENKYDQKLNSEIDNDYFFQLLTNDTLNYEYSDIKLSY
ncbi:hypothetical protein HMPREF9716_03749, partial [Myroides odoratus CIP 103059]